MARRKKEEKVTDPFERARLKKLRAAQRREERKKRKTSGDVETSRRETKPDYDQPMVKDDFLWLRKGLAKSFANSVINDSRERPFWLSFSYESARENGPLPISNYHPCTIFRVKGRAYYGFLFREHRDLFFATLEDARKETTDRVRAINPSVF